MWIRYIQNGQGFVNGNVVGTTTYEEARELVNSGIAIRVLDPDGHIFEEAAPEDILAYLAAEDNSSVVEAETKLQEQMAEMTDDQKASFMRGQYMP